MRVTDAMIRDQIITYLGESQGRLVEVQKQLSTNTEVARSSDDPVRFERAGRFRGLLTRNEQYLGNIEDGIAWIKIGTESLDVMHEAMQQIHEIGLQVRGDASPDSREQVIEYVDALIEEMVLMGDTSFMGKYIFGGTITKDTEPFTYDGSSVTYNGNNGVISRKVGEATYLQINTVGSEFVDIFDSVIALRDALVANDGLAIDAALALIDEAEPDLLNTITKAGSLQRKLELTRDNLEAAEVNLQSYISQAEDVDLAEAILRFNAQELGYRAALESSTRIMGISILNYLQ
jgi:flagellar hook-associated protein 3 FlgL